MRDGASRRRFVRSGVGRGAVERQYRQSGELANAGWNVRPQHAAHRAAILDRQRSKDRREIDRRKFPLRHQRDRARSAQQIADLGRAKAGVDMDGERAEPGAGEDRGEVGDAIRQPERHPGTWADARRAQAAGDPQHPIRKRAPVQRAGGIGHHRRRRVPAGPGHQRAQCARIVRSIGLAHSRSSISSRVRRQL